MAKKEKTNNEIYEFLTGFSAKTERLFGLVTERLGKVDKEIKDLKTSIGNLEQDVWSIKEDMGAVTGAIYSNVEALKNHGRRITRLERTH